MAAMLEAESVLVPAQLPGDEVAAAVAEEKAHSLNAGHEGKDHAHRAGGAVAFSMPTKKVSAML